MVSALRPDEPLGSYADFTFLPLTLLVKSYIEVVANITILLFTQKFVINTHIFFTLIN